MNPVQTLLLGLTICIALPISAVSQQPSEPNQQPPTKQSPPPADEWGDDFSGSDLDPAKWERFSFEGGSGGTLRVEEGQLRLRGVSGARSGVRSKPVFNADRFIVEGTVAKAGPALPEAGRTGEQLGHAIVTVLFDGSGRNRIEWIITSEGTLEAWVMVDGRGERIDKRNLATKAKNPTLAIVRRGDEFLFMLNGQEGLRKTFKHMPHSFHVMLYGFGSSENNWDSVRVVTIKQSPAN